MILDCALYKKIQGDSQNEWSSKTDGSDWWVYKGTGLWCLCVCLGYGFEGVCEAVFSGVKVTAYMHSIEQEDIWPYEKNSVYYNCIVYDGNMLVSDGNWWYNCAYNG